MDVKLGWRLVGRRSTLVLVTGMALLLMAACGRATPQPPALATPIPTYTSIPAAGAAAATPTPTTADVAAAPVTAVDEPA
ncbi:MAG: hypothetical protein KDD83_29490, partial [Caldilineaceae bacterium]|nr:hypothetical protein [Caldilineaceae bacterium]